MSGPASYAVVVLAGGTSRRMGGGDKTALDLGAGHSVLSHLVSGLDTSVPVVVVGASRPLERSVRWARESPPGGGPVAGLVAGLARLADGPGPQPEWVLVLAGDQPYAAAAAGPLTEHCGPGADLVLGVDAEGRDQPLLAVYRVTALLAALADVAAPPPAEAEGVADPRGRSMRSVVESVAARRPAGVVRVPLPARLTLDVDDAADLSAARDALTGSADPPGLPPPR